MRKIIDKFLIILIGINFLYVLSGVVNFPIYSIDVLSIWLFKAKGFYFSGGDLFGFLKSVDYSHPQYPILLPYLFYQIFLLLGKYKEIYVLVLYPFLYLLAIYLCYKTLVKLKISNTFLILFTYFYSMFSPLLAMGGRGHAGEADIFIVLAYWLLVFLAIDFVKDRKVAKLLLIFLVVFIASLIKTEGLLLAAAFLFLPIRKLYKVLLIIFFLGLAYLWQYIAESHGVYSDLHYSTQGYSDILNRAFMILYYTFVELVKVKNWYVFWPLFGFILAITKIKDNIFVTFSMPMFFVVFVFLFCNYLLSSIPPNLYVPSSIDRILMQLSALYFPVFAKQSYLVLKRTLS